MPKRQTSVYLDADIPEFLREHKYLTGQTQKDVVNRAIRLFALVHDFKRLEQLFGKTTAAKIHEVATSLETVKEIPAKVAK